MTVALYQVYEDPIDRRRLCEVVDLNPREVTLMDRFGQRSRVPRTYIVTAHPDLRTRMEQAFGWLLVYDPWTGYEVEV